MLGRNIVRETTLRLFVACPLPAAVREALAAAQRRLKEAGAPPLRWVRPQGIHLTLKFLGEVPLERLEAIRGALGEGVAGCLAFELALAGLAAFGGRRGPRVLWAGLVGDTARLAALQRRVEAALVPLGFPAEERPFSPHLTLARVPQELPPPQRRRLEELTRTVEVAPAVVAVSSVSLMRSTLDPAGAIYHELASFPLSG